MLSKRRALPRIHRRHLPRPHRRVCHHEVGMNCACGQARPEGAKFCPECGAAFAPRCPSCGADLTPAAKFCAECGLSTKGVGGAGKDICSPLPNPRPPTPVSARKVVTILFADLAGSTALHEGLDPES